MFHKLLSLYESQREVKILLAIYSDVKGAKKIVVGPIKSNTGFSLLEALVGLVLVIFVALGIASMQLLAVETSDAAQDTTELTMVAVDLLEHLASMPFDDPELAAGGSLTASKTGFSADPMPNAPSRYLRWQIVDDSRRIKRLTVVVGERDGRTADAREVQIGTYRLLLQ